LRNANSTLIAVAIGTLTLLLLTLYPPMISSVFRFAPLAWQQLLEAGGVALLGVVLFGLFRR
jgi:hypothetical protein